MMFQVESQWNTVGQEAPETTPRSQESQDVELRFPQGGRLTCSEQCAGTDLVGLYNGRAYAAHLLE